MANKNGEETELKLPPYLSFKTVQGFVQKLKETVAPPRIESSVLRSYSGSVGRKLTIALKFLELIEQDGRTTEKLTRLVKVFGTSDWPGVLGGVLWDAYKDVIGDLNLETATPGLLEEKFKARGAEGAVLRDCVNFYVSAMKEAGATISPHILNKPRARGERRGRPKKAQSKLQETEYIQPAMEPVTSGGTVRFSFPIPGKPAVTMFLPAELEAEDWVMVDAMVRAYIERRSKG